MIKVAASLMCVDPLHLGEELKKLESANVDFLHCDVMDGVYVPNITMGFDQIKAIKESTKVPLDVHLMVECPDTYLKTLADIDVDYVTVHVETTRHLHRTIQSIKLLGMKAGIALNPATPIETIKYVIKEVDIVLIMTVNPGFAGQKFIEDTIEKIEDVKNLIKEKGINPFVQVDGNININTIPKVVSAGANLLVLGSSSLFKGPLTDYRAEVDSIKKFSESHLVV